MLLILFNVVLQIKKISRDILGFFLREIRTKLPLVPSSPVPLTPQGSRAPQTSFTPQAYLFPQAAHYSPGYSCSPHSPGSSRSPGSPRSLGSHSQAHHAPLTPKAPLAFQAPFTSQAPALQALWLPSFPTSQGSSGSNRSTEFPHSPG